MTDQIQNKFDVYTDTADGTCKLLQKGVIASSKPAALALVTDDPNAWAVPEGTDPSTVPAIIPVEGDDYNVFIHSLSPGVSAAECVTPVLKLVASDPQDALRRGVEAGALKSDVAYVAVLVQDGTNTPASNPAPVGSHPSKSGRPHTQPPGATKVDEPFVTGALPEDAAPRPNGHETLRFIAEEHGALMAAQLRRQVKPSFERMAQEHVLMLSTLVSELTEDELTETLSAVAGVPVPQAHQPPPEAAAEPDSSDESGS